MKNQLLTISPIQKDYVLEGIMQKRHSELMELARKDARHFATQNRPALEGDKLFPFTGGITTGYEQLASEVFHHGQPAAHFPEAKMDADHLREKDKGLETEIRAKEDQNSNDQYELGNYNPGSIPMRLWITGVSTAIITAGEIIFNTKSFQITGETLLFALIISCSISFAVLAAAHVAAFLFKSAKTVLKRRLVVWCSILIITVVFAVLAILRTRYLESHEVNISPGYFVIFNLFFFIVSSLISLFLLPTIEELKQQLKHIKLYRGLQKRQRAIGKLHQERNRLKEIILANTKYRLREVHNANYAADKIRKMHRESIETFKTTNLIFRKDKRTPDCFFDPLPEPDIQDITITYLSPKS